MLFKTRGIVLNYVKYSESSIIVKIYTETLGIQSYIVNSVRSKSSKPKIALYQPLTLLDLVVYYKQANPIHRISEIRCITPLHSLPYDFKKSCMAMFITEILSKTLREEPSNSDLFSFLYSSVLALDNLIKNFENFHLQFLLGLAGHLGFSPDSAETIIEELYHSKYANQKLTQLLDELIANSYSNYVAMSNESRREILEILLKFYEYHVTGLGELKSLDVLKDLMS